MILQNPCLIDFVYSQYFLLAYEMQNIKYRNFCIQWLNYTLVTLRIV